MSDYYLYKDNDTELVYQDKCDGNYIKFKKKYKFVQLEGPINKIEAFNLHLSTLNFINEKVQELGWLGSDNNE